MGSIGTSHEAIGERGGGSRVEKFSQRWRKPGLAGRAWLLLLRHDNSVTRPVRSLHSRPIVCSFRALRLLAPEKYDP